VRLRTEMVAEAEEESRRESTTTYRGMMAGSDR